MGDDKKTEDLDGIDSGTGNTSEPDESDPLEGVDGGRLIPSTINVGGDDNPLEGVDGGQIAVQMSAAAPSPRSSH